jgi:hypothetical protein
MWPLRGAAQAAKRGAGELAGVLWVGLAAYAVIPELHFVVQSGAELKIQPLSTNTLMVTWQSCWTCEVLSWAHGAERGPGEQAGGGRVLRGVA